MKSVMKKLFSLLLVGVVTVSMFGFVAPLVEAAEANASSDKIIITSFVKHAEKIKVITGTRGGAVKSFEIRPKGIFSNQCSFKTKSPVNEISITFCICELSNPKIKREIKAKFWKSDFAPYEKIVRDPDKSISINIDKNAKAVEDAFNGWHLMSSSNKII